MNKRGRKIGMRMKPESKKKISDTLMGHPVSDETKQAISKGVRRSKIDKPEVNDILKMYNDGHIPIESIAAIYGISTKHVYSLVKVLEGVNYDE